MTFGSSVFSKATSLGIPISDLLGIGHPDGAVDEEFFNQILDNQRRIITSISRIASALNSFADILDLIPYKTAEIEENLRATSIFIRSQGLLTTVGNAIAEGTDLNDKAFVSAYEKLVDEVDAVTARYVTAVNILGQSHDLCVAIRPIWNAIQSIRDTGKIIGAATPGFEGRLLTAAIRVREIALLIADGSAPPGLSKFGIFREKFEPQKKLFDESKQPIEKFIFRKEIGQPFYIFKIRKGFMSGVGGAHIDGVSKTILTEMMPVCIGGVWGKDGELVCPIKEVIVQDSEIPATMSRALFTQKPGMEGVFKLTMEPMHKESPLYHEVEKFNDEASKFSHYAAVETLLREVIGEINLRTDKW